MVRVECAVLEAPAPSKFMPPRIDPTRLSVGTTITYRFTSGGDDFTGVITRAPFPVGFFDYVAVTGPAVMWVPVDNIISID